MLANLFFTFFFNTMSMFGDYKAYKKFAPNYAEWKSARNLAEEKRQIYLKNNINELDKNDIQRSKTILRAIDVMDEYSQKRAEDMEVATESVVSTGLQFAVTIGMGLGALLTNLSPIKAYLKKHSNNYKKISLIMMLGTMAFGGIASTIAAFPLFAWAAKAEVKASRKGRFEAMRKELDDPKTFAVLNSVQEAKLEENLNKLSDKEEKKTPLKSIRENWNTVKEMVTDSNEYKKQKFLFEQSLQKDKKFFKEELSPEEIEVAKKDQQLLTKLVEKIDLASQDYAENAELATTTLTTLVFALGTLFALGYEKLAKFFKWKQTAVPAGVALVATLGASSLGAGIQKQAARVGRFKAKQELMKNPGQLVYVSDEKIENMNDVKAKKEKKTNIFKFILEAWKNNREFEKWKKDEGLKEKNLSKAMEGIELSDEQLKEAKRIQYNTFKTFNKIDENSQKYSESIEALGQAVQYPLAMIFSTIGLIFGSKYTHNLANSAKAKDLAMHFIKYFSIIFLSTLPSLFINAYITKEQKNASRVADMIAINELQDYRNFADYSKFSSKVQ